MNGEKFLTTEELAEIVKFSTKTLISWRKQKKGPSWLKLGHAVRYRESEVLRWMKDQEQEGSSN